MYSKVLTVIALSALAFVAVGCETTPTQQGAMFGGAVGSGLGAIVGHQSGNAAEGALIGGAAGALTGGVAGNAIGKNQQQQRRQVQQPQEHVSRGHYERRIVEGPNGETYEERVWVEDQ